MSYYNDLTLHLRMRRVPEQQIIDVLREVHNLAQESGRAPDEQFGPASAYAEEFPKGNVSSTARKAAIALITVALTVIAVDLVQIIFTDMPFRVGSIRLSLLLIPVQIVALAMAYFAERRLPHDFTSTAGDHA